LRKLALGAIGQRDLDHGNSGRSIGQEILGNKKARGTPRFLVRGEKDTCRRDSAAD
jgi:hypothetical protein